MTLKKALAASSLCLMLAACSSDSPYVEGWNDEPDTSLDQISDTVNICFSRKKTSQQQVFAMAREACAQKALLRQEFIERDVFAQAGTTLEQAEGGLFGGPVARQQRMRQVESQTQVEFTGSFDRWNCSLVHPVRATFQCLFPTVDPRQTQPVQSTSPVPVQPALPRPERPPELPEDLRPDTP